MDRPRPVTRYTTQYNTLSQSTSVTCGSGYIVSIRIVGVEFDHSNGAWPASASIGKSMGQGITRIQSKTFAMVCR
jgi:hypothetical protein